MPIRSSRDTKHLFYPVFNRIIQHSRDGGKTLPTRVVSSTRGPFDFSEVSDPASVEIQVKADNLPWMTSKIDLSSAPPSCGISSVTSSELVDALNASDLGVDIYSLATESGARIVTETEEILSCSIVCFRAEIENGTNLVKLFLNSPNGIRYVQIKGELALAAGITAQIFNSDTQKSFGITPKITPSERLETKTSTGIMTSVVYGAYRTGSELTLTDTAMSKELRAAIEGGTLENVPGYEAMRYSAPGPETNRPSLSVEVFYAIYGQGINVSSVPIGYLWNRYDSCTGITGSLAGDKAAQNWTYVIDACPYRNPVDGVTDQTDEYSQELNTDDFTALDVFNV